MPIPISERKKNNNRYAEEMAGIASIQHNLPIEPPVRGSDSCNNTAVSAMSAAAPKKSISTTPDAIKAKDLSSSILDRYNNQNNSSIEALFHEIMRELLTASSGFMQLQKNLIEAQTEIRDKITKEFFKKQEELNEQQKISDSLSTFTQVSAPLALIVSGATAIMTGGISLLAGAALTIGSLTLLDTIFDSVTKKQLAEWLSRTREESVEVWLGRIYLAAQIASFGMACALPHADIFRFIQGISALTAKIVETGAQISEKEIKAALLEIENELKRAKNSNSEYTDSFSNTNKTVEELTHSVFSVMNSLRKTATLVH